MDEIAARGKVGRGSENARTRETEREKVCLPVLCVVLWIYIPSRKKNEKLKIAKL